MQLDNHSYLCFSLSGWSRSSYKPAHDSNTVSVASWMKQVILFCSLPLKSHIRKIKSTKHSFTVLAAYKIYSLTKSVIKLAKTVLICPVLECFEQSFERSYKSHRLHHPRAHVQKITSGRHRQHFRLYFKL